jgi:hypothetical protein
MTHLATDLPPLGLHADSGAELFFAVLMAVVVVGACAWTLRRRNPLLLILAVAAAASSFIEPVYDYLGQAWWSTDLTTSFTSFGGRVFCPTIFPLGYAMWIGLGSYASFRVFERRPSRNSILKAFVLLALCEPALELPWLATHLFRYYGHQPFRVIGYSLVWDAINTAGIAITGAVLLWLGDRGSLRGRGALLVAILPFAVIGWYCAAGWPLWLAMHTSAPVWVRWVLGALAIAASSAAVTGAATAVAATRKRVAPTAARTQDGSLAGTVDPSSAAAEQPPVSVAGT